MDGWCTVPVIHRLVFDNNKIKERLTSFVDFSAVPKRMQSINKLVVIILQVELVVHEPSKPRRYTRPPLLPASVWPALSGEDTWSR